MKTKTLKTIKSSGRPSESDRNSKKENIIKAARAELLKTGGTSFSLNQVLTAAGGSKTTFYSYFGSREGLLEAVLTDVVNDAFINNEILQANSSPKTILTRIAQGTYDAVLSKEAIALYRMSIGEVKDSPALSKIFYENGPLVARKVLSGILKEFHDKKELKIKNTELAADIFFGMLLEGPLLNRMLLIPSKEDLEVRIDEVVRIFIAGHST